jgi:hypothetical protein
VNSLEKNVNLAALYLFKSSFKSIKSQNEIQFEKKEFIKAQTVIAETIQEYFSETSSKEIAQYTQINIDLLNTALPATVSVSLFYKY